MGRALFIFLMLCCLPAAGQGANSYRVLCYHDVQEDVRVNPDPYAVDTAQLVSQFAWLRENAYKVVSLDDVIAAREGRRSLPDKAVLLSFDDGYRSAYTRVFPLLKLFGYPAVVALSGRWLDAPADGKVEYDGTEVPRSQFLSWEEISEMRASGLIEIASHSYDLHRGVVANPQRSLIPAAVSYQYTDRGYEEQDAHVARIRADLARNSALIKSKTGRAPRAMVWPFGAYSAQAIEIARELGMPFTMNLDGGVNDPAGDLSRIRRDLIVGNPALNDFIVQMKKAPRPAPQRVVQVDLDYVYDANARQQQANLDRLIERMRALRASTVYLQAFSDPDGNGQAEALYFPNRHLPMRADLFSYVAWQLHTRAEVKVYAWMPVLAFELPSQNAVAHKVVQSSDPQLTDSSGRYRRLTPFSVEVRATIGEIYEDLARHARLDGLLFHDDALLDDFEDDSDPARQTYAQWGFPSPVDAIRADAQAFERWTRRKTAVLIAFTGELAQRVRRYQGEIKTARNLYARPVLEPRSEARFAQTLPDFLSAYDYTALMAMPRLEGAVRRDEWLDTLVGKVAQQPGGLNKTVFELQSFDWNTGKPVPTSELAAQMLRLQRSGALNIGYYPDDFPADHPALSNLKPALSLQSFPRKD